MRANANNFIPSYFKVGFERGSIALQPCNEYLVSFFSMQRASWIRNYRSTAAGLYFYKIIVGGFQITSADYDAGPRNSYRVFLRSAMQLVPVLYAFN